MVIVNILENTEHIVVGFAIWGVSEALNYSHRILSSFVALITRDKIRKREGELRFDRSMEMQQYLVIEQQIWKQKNRI